MIFQIWIGDKPEDRIKYMKSVIDISDSYILFSNKNYFNKNKKIKWVDVNKVIHDLFLEYPELETVYNNLSIENKSDLLRFYILSKFDNSMYVDTDVILNEIPLFEYVSVPYFSKYKNKNADTYIIYNNNNKEFFINLLNFYKDKLKEEQLIRLNGDTKHIFWYLLQIYLKNSCYKLITNINNFIHMDLIDG